MNNKEISINGIKICLSQAEEIDIKPVGLTELQKQLEACWITLSKEDLPLVPRVIGPPGSGKTTLVYSVGKKLKQDIYMMQCTMDTRPEDLIILPVLDENKKIRYQASPLLSAAINGGIAILDEGNRMDEKTWASLATLLDSRRYLYSSNVGIKIKAHPKFKCCVTMNDDASTFEIPEYIMSRLQPQINVEFPSKEEEKQILKVNLPFAHDKLIAKMSDFLFHVHQFEEPYSTRDGINVVKFANRLMKNEGKSLDKALTQSIEQILGKNAVDYLNPDYQPDRQADYQPSLNTINDITSFWGNYPDEDDNELV